MNEEQLIQLLLTNGGATGLIVAIIIIVKKVWSVASSQYLKTVKETTESSLIGTLMDDIERIRNELKEVKEDHRKDLEAIRANHSRDKDELMERISRLKVELAIFKRRNESMRHEALEAYTYLINCEHRDDHCAECHEELKNKLMGIALPHMPECQHAPENDGCN